MIFGGQQVNLEAFVHLFVALFGVAFLVQAYLLGRHLDS